MRDSKILTVLMLTKKINIDNKDIDSLFRSLFPPITVQSIIFEFSSNAKAIIIQNFQVDNGRRHVMLNNASE